MSSMAAMVDRRKTMTCAAQVDDVEANPELARGCRRRARIAFDCKAMRGTKEPEPVQHQAGELRAVAIASTFGGVRDGHPARQHQAIGNPLRAEPRAIRVTISAMTTPTKKAAAELA